ncbi:sigma factor-like helix-turn-helix DNA-binding protein [Nocardia yamanashiensis]|uniref:sigma factor-like helix-turn-helix DNA-binding protein n=1 Tax=Nocardia yamanashiensis TaxID=209247 RepID=UPI00082C9B53|nr:sigma factor-like helix-turn-helix DNA-binding protein [Nocardia yamanashiensis]
MPNQSIGRPSPALSDGCAKDIREALSPVHHTVLYVRIGLGWTVERTADAMGIAPEAVRLMQHRALTRLRERLHPVDR